MRLKTCFLSLGLLAVLLVGGMPGLLHPADPLTNDSGDFTWIPIPEGAEAAPLVEQEVRRLAAARVILPFERTTGVFEHWIALKRNLSAAWQQRFHERRETLRQALQIMSEQTKTYRKIVNRLSLAETALQSARQRIDFLDEQLQSLQNEQNILQQNFQAQLDGFGFQLMLQGSARQRYESSLPQEELRTQLGLAMSFQAIRDWDETLVQTTTMLQNYELISSRVQSVLQGRSETTATYPIGISKAWRKNGHSIGKITHLFHIITVYPFYTRATGSTTVSGGETLPMLSPEPEIIALTGVNLHAVLYEIGIDDSNLEHFLESWLRLIEEANEDTMRRLQEVRSAFQIQGHALKARTQALQEERAAKRCEVLHLRWQIHGPTPALEQAWPARCADAGPSDKLLDAKTLWEAQTWPGLSRDFQVTHREYAQTYAVKTVVFEKVSDGKSQPNESLTDTWVRVAQNAFATLRREISAQDYKEDILIIGQRLSDYRETTVTYQKIPKAFTILYLADHESDNQVVQIAGVGVKYRFQSERTFSIPLTLSEGAIFASKTQCDLQQLEQLFRYNISLERIADRCGLATSIDIPPDQEMWSLVKRTTLPEEVQEFIRAYPQSRLMPAARLKLQQLQRRQSE